MFNNDYYQYYDLNSNLGNSISNFTKKAKHNWTDILNTTQKTLNIINQIIPIIYQFKPIYNNAKTIFKVMNVIKDDKQLDKPNILSNQETTNTIKKKESNDSSPTFFL